MASGLKKLGFGPGNVLQTGLSSTLGFYWGVLGAWMCGGRVSVPDPNLDKEMIKVQIEDTKAKVIVCGLEYVAKYSMLVEEFDDQGSSPAPILFVLDADENDVLPQGVTRFQTLLDDDGLEAPTADMLPEYDPQEPTVIFWSSGSTGAPKGVVHSQNNMHNSMLNFDDEESGHRVLISNAMFHVGGFNIGIIQGLLNEKTVCFIPAESFSPEHCLDLLQQYRPQRMVLGINHYISLGNVPLQGREFTGLEYVTPAGGAISPGITAKVMKLLGPDVMNAEFYGSTECWLASKTTGRETTLGALGHLSAGVQVYIQDTETGERLGPGEEGKIMVRTKTMMLGFLNRPEATQEFFDAEGYGFIGDVGFYNEQGDLFFSHRMKDAMKVNNCWVGPGEIENVLESEDDIDEAGVWGRYDPNTGSEVINLAIVFKKGVKPWSEDRIRQLVSSRLLPTRRITGSIYYVDSLPHSAVGKKVRRHLAEYCLTKFKMEDLIKFAPLREHEKTSI